MVPHDWTCGHCGLNVGGNRGYYHNDGGIVSNVQPGQQIHPTQVSSAFPRIFICPKCDSPTYFHRDKQVPGAAYGRKILHLSPELTEVYDQARNCMSVAAHVPAVLAARTIL